MIMIMFVMARCIGLMRVCRVQSECKDPPICSRNARDVLLVFGCCLSAFFVCVRTALIVDRFIYRLEGC